MNRLIFPMIALLLWLVPQAALAQRGGEGFTVQEGLQFSLVGFSKAKKTVIVKVNDVQRGDYYSVYKSRTGEKLKDYPFTVDNEKRVFKRLKRKEELDDEGAEGGASPKDGTLINGIYDGKDLTLQVQSGKNLGVLDVIDPPKASVKLKTARIKESRWNTKGKLVVVFVTWEYEEDQIQATETIHIYRYRPWKVRWL
jgi:hypothetical protein